MKAIHVSEFGDPTVMQIVDLPIPKPSQHEILVKIEATGVNPVDTYIRQGTYPLLPKLPYTPGMDGSGTITELGSQISNLNLGDRVYLSGSLTGTYAEYALCTIDQVHPLPQSISFSQGAAIGIPGAAAWRALFIRGKVKAGENLLIHGASGTVGLAAIQLAKAAGLTVYGTAGSEQGMKLVEETGASAVFSHRQSDYIDQIKHHGAPGGFDIILEMLGNLNLEKDLELLAPGGRVVIIGSRGRIEIDPRATMGKETDIRGMSLFNASEQEMRQTHAGLLGAMESGYYTPVVASTYSYGEAHKAHQQALNNGNCGKIVLIPN